MRHCLALVVLLGGVVTAAESPQEAAPLDGVWKLTSVLGSGAENLLPPVEYRWHVQGDKVHYGGTLLVTLKLDAKTKPASLDLAFARPARTLEGILERKGDTLTLCVNRRSDGVKTRPQEFSAKGNDDFRLLTFTRVGGEKPDPLEGLAGFVGVQIRAHEDSKEIAIDGTLKDSPAEKAGLKKGDVLVQVNGGEVKSLQAVVTAVRGVKPGATLTLRVRRDGKELDVPIKAAVLPFFVLD